MNAAACPSLFKSELHMRWLNSVYVLLLVRVLSFQVFPVQDFHKVMTTSVISKQGQTKRSLNWANHAAVLQIVSLYSQNSLVVPMIYNSFPRCFICEYTLDKTFSLSVTIHLPQTLQIVNYEVIASSILPYRHLYSQVNLRILLK